VSVMPIVKVVRAASLLFSGLFAGFLLGVLVLENSLRGYDASVYTQVRQVELDSLDTLASVTLIPALLCTLVVAVLAIRARGNDRWLLLAAFALLVLVFITSLAINVPINGDQADWSVNSPPSDWASVRDRWQLAHVVRTVSAVLAFCSLIVAKVIRTVRSSTGARAASALVGTSAGSTHR
jgi:uncharacterized membrane protein